MKVLKELESLSDKCSEKAIDSKKALDSKKAIEKLKETIVYYGNNVERMDYPIMKEISYNQQSNRESMSS